MEKNYIEASITIEVSEGQKRDFLNEILFDTITPDFGGRYALGDLEVQYMSGAKNAFMDTNEISFVCTVFSAAVAAIQICDMINEKIKGKVKASPNIDSIKKEHKKIKIKISLPFFQYEEDHTIDLDDKER